MRPFCKWMFLVAIYLAFPKGALAASGYTDWHQMSFAEQIGYIEGIMDFTIIASPDEPFRRAFHTGLVDCTKNKTLTLSEIREDVDRLYGDYPSLRATEPSTIVYISLLRSCGEEINSQMTENHQLTLDWRRVIRNSESH